MLLCSSLQPLLSGTHPWPCNVACGLRHHTPLFSVKGRVCVFFWLLGLAFSRQGADTRNQLEWVVGQGADVTKTPAVVPPLCLGAVLLGLFGDLACALSLLRMAGISLGSNGQAGPSLPWRTGHFPQNLRESPAPPAFPFIANTRASFSIPPLPAHPASPQPGDVRAHSASQEPSLVSSAAWSSCQSSDEAYNRQCLCCNYCYYDYVTLF